MKLTLPIYVTRHEKEFTVQPLFFGSPVERHPKLERALLLLARALRERLRQAGQMARHDDLARYSYYPDLQFQRLALNLELRRRSHRCRFLFVLFTALGRRLAFTPSVPDVWFEVQRGDQLRDRATEVLTHHFRIREKEDEDHFLSPETLALEGTGWITPLDLDVYPSQSFLAEDKPARAALGAEDTTDGEGELHRVGRCLDHLYPDDLDRVVLRDSAVAELTRLLRAAERRPVLLLGPSLVGKTALLLAQSFHENLPEQVLVLVRQPTPSADDWKTVLSKQLKRTFSNPLLNLDSVPVEPQPGAPALAGRAIVFRGPGAWPLLQWEVGTHLFCPAHEGLVPVQVLAWPLPEGSDPLACLRERQREHETWQQQLLQGTAGMSDDPWRLQQVVRISREGKAFDLRTGLSWEPQAGPTPPWLKALPLPPELLAPSRE